MAMRTAHMDVRLSLTDSAEVFDPWNWVRGCPGSPSDPWSGIEPLLDVRPAFLAVRL